MKKLPSSTSTHPPLRYYKLQPEAFAPVWGTDYAGCFDMKACLTAGQKIKVFPPTNVEYEVEVTSNSIFIMPGCRMMIPSGLIFDIPVGYTVRAHSRSGLALKSGIVLANHEGVVDSDYVKQAMILVKNDSNVAFLVTHGDRIAQAEMVIDIEYDVIEIPEAPLPKTDRIGGFGSTGVQ